MIAVKYFDDHYYDNKYYAHVGGVRVAELDGLEAAFLQLIGRRSEVVVIDLMIISEWHLFVPAEEFTLCAKRFLMMGCRVTSTD